MNMLCGINTPEVRRNPEDPSSLRNPDVLLGFKSQEPLWDLTCHEAEKWPCSHENLLGVRCLLSPGLLYSIYMVTCQKRFQIPSYTNEKFELSKIRQLNWGPLTSKWQTWTWTQAPLLFFFSLLLTVRLKDFWQCHLAQRGACARMWGGSEVGDHGNRALSCHRRVPRHAERLYHFILSVSIGTCSSLSAIKKWNVV